MQTSFALPLLFFTKKYRLLFSTQSQSGMANLKMDYSSGFNCGTVITAPKECPVYSQRILVCVSGRRRCLLFWQQEASLVAGNDINH